MKKLLIFLSLLICLVDAQAQVKGNAPAKSYNGRGTFNNESKLDGDDFNPNPSTGYYNNPAPAHSRADSVFTISSKVMMNVTASSFMVQFHLTQVGETGQLCTETLDARINAFKADLSKLGINQDEVYTDMISFIPLYEYEITKKLFSKTANEVPSGFELKKNVHIRLQNDEILDKVLAAAAAHEIYDFAHFEYFVPDHEKIYDSIRRVALRILDEKLADFNKAGLKITPMFQTMSEKSFCVFPNERYTAYAAFGSNSLGYQKKGANITVTDVRKPNSYYYDHLEYNSFDAVLNSQFLEPQVQFVIAVQMTYTQQRPVK